MADQNKILFTPIFIYDDYVDYLQDWSGRAKSHGYTQKEFIQKSGIKSHALFSDVLGRRKTIGRANLNSFVKALKLKSDEAEFFRLLCMKDIIKNPEERKEVFNKLQELRKKNIFNLLKEKNLEYFASWKYSVIREYVISKGQVNSPKEIVKGLINFKLTSREVENVLKKLEAWGMVVYDKNSESYKALVESVLTYKDLPHSILNDIKKTMMEAGIHAMEMMPKEERHVSMSIKGLSEKSYKQLVKKINDLRNEMLETDDKNADRIASLNIQLFPVANIDRKKGSKND